MNIVLRQQTVKKLCYGFMLLALLLFSFGSSRISIVYATNPPPVNDLFANATPITGLPYNPGLLDTTEASKEPGEPNPGDYSGGCEGGILRAGLATV